MDRGCVLCQRNGNNKHHHHHHRPLQQHVAATNNANNVKQLHQVYEDEKREGEDNRGRGTQNNSIHINVTPYDNDLADPHDYDMVSESSTAYGSESSSRSHTHPHLHSNQLQLEPQSQSDEATPLFTPMSSTRTGTMLPMPSPRNDDTERTVRLLPAQAAAATHQQDEESLASPTMRNHEMKHTHPINATNSNNSEPSPQPLLIGTAYITEQHIIYNILHSAPTSKATSTPNDRPIPIHPSNETTSSYPYTYSLPARLSIMSALDDTGKQHSQKQEQRQKVSGQLCIAYSLIHKKPSSNADRNGGSATTTATSTTSTPSNDSSLYESTDDNDDDDAEDENHDQSMNNINKLPYSGPVSRHHAHTHASSTTITTSPSLLSIRIGMECKNIPSTCMHQRIQPFLTIHDTHDSQCTKTPLFISEVHTASSTQSSTIHRTSNNSKNTVDLSFDKQYTLHCDTLKNTQPRSLSSSTLAPLRTFYIALRHCTSPNLSFKHSTSHHDMSAHAYTNTGTSGITQSESQSMPSNVLLSKCEVSYQKIISHTGAMISSGDSSSTGANGCTTRSAPLCLALTSPSPSLKKTTQSANSSMDFKYSLMMLHCTPVMREERNDTAADVSPRKSHTQKSASASSRITTNRNRNRIRDTSNSLAVPVITELRPTSAAPDLPQGNATTLQQNGGVNYEAYGSKTATPTLTHDSATASKLSQGSNRGAVNEEAEKSGSHENVNSNASGIDLRLHVIRCDGLPRFYCKNVYCKVINTAHRSTITVQQPAILQQQQHEQDQDPKNHDRHTVPSTTTYGFDVMTEVDNTSETATEESIHVNNGENVSAVVDDDREGDAQTKVFHDVYSNAPYFGYECNIPIADTFREELVRVANGSCSGSGSAASTNHHASKMTLSTATPSSHADGDAASASSMIRVEVYGYVDESVALYHEVKEKCHRVEDQYSKLYDKYKRLAKYVQRKKQERERGREGNETDTPSLNHTNSNMNATMNMSATAPLALCKSTSLSQLQSQSHSLCSYSHSSNHHTDGDGEIL